VLDDALTAGRIAAELVEARQQARPLLRFPGELPATLGEAYRIQSWAMQRVSDTVAGWKVGRILPPLSERYGADRLAGPIFSRLVIEDTGTRPPAAGVYGGGFGAAEAEFLLRLARSPATGQQHFTLAEAAALIDRVHVGLEIASSPLATINDLGPTVIAADFGNNNGLVIGPQITDWQSGQAFDWPVVTQIDGKEAGRGVASAMPDGPIGAVRFLLELCAVRGIQLPPGSWVSSGAVSGVHEVHPGQQVVARFGAGHIVRCDIAAVSPQTQEYKR